MESIRLPMVNVGDASTRKALRTSLKRCWNCKCEEDPLNKRQMCARCKTAMYCGPDCQRAHWESEHKHDCKNLVSDKQPRDSRYMELSLRATIKTHDWSAYKPTVWVVLFPQDEVSNGMLENFMFVPTPPSYAEALRKKGFRFPADTHCFKIAGQEYIAF